MRKVLLLIIFSAFSVCTYAQVCKNPYTIVVIGSSTAEGKNATFRKGWVFLYLDEYLTQLNSKYVVQNLAVSGYTSYKLLPSDYVTPAGKDVVDPAHNITQALAAKPNAIILSLASNDAMNNYSLTEQQDNYKRIIAAATAQGVPVWVTTTQPRNGLTATQLKLQKDMRDWIINYFGDKAINFWNAVATPNDSIRSEYASYDNIHLTNDGHRVLYELVVARGIIETLCKEEIVLSAYTGKPVEDKIQLDWSTSKEKNMTQFIIERSVDAVDWKAAGQVPAVGNATTTKTYTFKDNEIQTKPMFYRLNMEAQNGNHSFSKEIKVIPDTLYTIPFRLASFKIAPKQSKLELNWVTQVEKNMKEYIVERSLDKQVWVEAGRVSAVGTSDVPKNYLFTDDIPKSVYVYYSLNITDKQNRKFYSDILQASGLITGLPNMPSDEVAVRVSPNPANDQVLIENLPGYLHELKIYNQSGALVYVKQEYQKGTSINVSALPAGLYLIVIDDGKYRLKLIKI
jgi:lysophospholipase L1-like esterase